jgi:hypothetical protein
VPSRPNGARAALAVLAGSAGVTVINPDLNQRIRNKNGMFMLMFSRILAAASLNRFNGSEKTRFLSSKVRHAHPESDS